MRTFPSTLPLHVPQLHITQATHPYTATYHLAVPMKRVPQQSAAPYPLYLISTPCVQKTSVKTSYTIPDHIMDNKEDFQTIILDDDHWTTDPISDRCVCIHEHLQPNSLCSYPSPYSLNPVSYNSDYAPALHLRCWTSVTFLTLSMWWPLPVIRISLLWMTCLHIEAYRLWFAKTFILHQPCTYIGSYDKLP